MRKCVFNVFNKTEAQKVKPKEFETSKARDVLETGFFHITDIF
jgi:hypothetical protein